MHEALCSNVKDEALAGCGGRGRVEATLLGRSFDWDNSSSRDVAEVGPNVILKGNHDKDGGWQPTLQVKESRCEIQPLDCRLT